MKRPQKQVAEATRQPIDIIDASGFAPALSPEIVTEGMITGIQAMAVSILERTGQDSTVNGIPARVSSINVPVSIGGDTQYARVFQINPKKGQNPELPSIVFDKTPDDEVVSTNFRAVRFTEVGNRTALIIDDAELAPTINDPVAVKNIADILVAMGKSITESEKQKQQLALDTQLEKQQARHFAVQRFKHGAGKIGRVCLIIMGLSATGYGAVYGLGKISLPEDFDDKNIPLAGGTELVIGQVAANPEYSQELFSSSELRSAALPDIEEDENDYSGEDRVLELDNSYREVILRSSKPTNEDQCQSIIIDKVPLDTRLVAWTDFTSASGASRADELTINYELGKAVICWTGQESGPEEDPRVVIKLRPADQSKPR